MNASFNAGSVSVPLVPYDVTSTGPATLQASQQSSIPRSLTTYHGHGKRDREIDDVDETSEAKRVCVIDPRECSLPSRARAIQHEQHRRASC